MTDIENEFFETIRKFFPPERNPRIDSDYYVRQNDPVTIVSAHVTVKGDSVRPYDETALLEEIDGSVHESSDTKVVIQGKFQGRACGVTITCTPAAVQTS